MFPFAAKPLTQFVNWLTVSVPVTVPPAKGRAGV
jgi:hypothetical protein